MTKRLLIVEDNRMLARNLARFMERAGFAVQMAADGAQARRALDTGRVDILCLDVRLPDRNGLDLLAEIRPRHGGLPVVVMTGQDLPEYRTRAENLDAAAFLVKPFPMSRLKKIAGGIAFTDHPGAGSRGGRVDRPVVPGEARETLIPSHHQKENTPMYEGEKTPSSRPVLHAIDGPAGKIDPFDPQRRDGAKLAYSTHAVPDSGMSTLITGRPRPRAGDLVLARIEDIGQHQRIELRNGRRARLFPGDEVVVCYGNRYAPDQFEAEVPLDLGPCDLAAAGGVAARTRSRHQSMKPATRILPVGLVGDSTGRPVNLRDFSLAPVSCARAVPTVAVVGTTMNSGKTTTAAHLVRGLVQAGYRVGTAKVTGTGAGGDLWHATDAGSSLALDFTHAGVPSTYLVDEDALIDIFETLVGTLAADGVDAIVLEVADGLRQRETSILLRAPAFRKRVDGVVFAAYDALGAVAGAEWLRGEGMEIRAVSGRLTASPLGTREASDAIGVPILSCADLDRPDCAMAVLGGECQPAPAAVGDDVAATAPAESSLAIAV